MIGTWLLARKRANRPPLTEQAPFVLRRLKTDVLHTLPPKSEENLRPKMTSKQCEVSDHVHPDEILPSRHLEWTPPPKECV